MTHCYPNNHYQQLLILEGDFRNVRPLLEQDTPVPPEDGGAPGGHPQLTGRVVVAHVVQLGSVGL